MYRRVEVPIKEVVFLEFFGLLFVDTSIILEDELEDELEDGLWSSLDKMDGYSYATVSSVLRDNGRFYIPLR